PKSDIIKPVSDLFLSNGLVSKVYAGRHADTTFAENNDPFPNIDGAVIPVELNDEVSGCTLFPISWPDNEVTDPWDSGQIVATFSSYDAAATWASAYYEFRCSIEPEGPEPPDTFLDIQYYDQE